MYQCLMQENLFNNNSKYRCVYKCIYIGGCIATNIGVDINIRHRREIRDRESLRMKALEIKEMC